MAQEPSGSGGQQPSEYDYGQQWHQPDQASSAASGAPAGYEAYGSGQDAWSTQQQAQQAEQQAYYGGYEQQQYGQQYQQPYEQQQQYAQAYTDQTYTDPAYTDPAYTDQGYGTGGYGYGTTAPGQDQAAPYGTQDASYGGGVQGYQDYTAAEPYPYPYQEQAQQQDNQQQPAASDDDATQQWQAPDYGDAPDPAPAAPAGPPSYTAPPNLDAAEEDDRPGSLADRVRAALAAGGDGPGRRTLLIRAGLGATALAVLIGAGVYVAGGDSSGGGSAGTGSGTASARFSVDHTKAWAAQPAAAGADDNLLGSWLLAKAVVRGDGTGVHAYDIATGKQLWTLQPPQPGAVPCGMSPTASGGGTGAVLFAPKAGSKTCTLLSAVDTATGKQKWTKSLSDTKDAYSARAMVNDNRVVAVGDSRAVGYDAGSGKQQWENKGRGKFCTLSGAGSGGTVLIHSSCADSSPKEQIVALDAGSGRLVWWRGLGTPKTVSVLSAEPAVVLTTGAGEADDKVKSWDNKGNPGAEIPVAQDGGRLDVGHGVLDATPGVFFNATTMAAALVPANGSTPVNGSLTAVDLKTGKPLWKTAAREKGKVQPVGLDGDALVVATEERTDQPAHLSRFALADGSETAGGGFPKDTGSVLTAGRVLTADGLVVAVPTFTSTYGTSATAYRAGS